MTLTLRMFLTTMTALLAVVPYVALAAGAGTGSIPEHPSLRNVPLGLVPDAGVGSGRVLDLIEFDDGSGPTIYAAGDFVTVGDRRANSLARQVDGHWWPLPIAPTAARQRVVKLDVLDGALYVAGDLSVDGSSQGQQLMPAVARWSGRSFEHLPLPSLFSVPAIVVLDNRLAVIGIRLRDGAATSGYAFWDGTSLRLGPADAFTPWDYVTVHEGALHAVGYAQSETRVARWTGSNWSLIPGVFTVGPSALVSGGDSLYVGGSGARIAGLAETGLYRWRNGTWDALTGGRSLPIHALGFLDNRLYVTRSNSGSCVPATCARAVDTWEDGVAQPPQFDRAGAATRIVRLGDELVLGGVFDDFHESDDGGRGSPLLSVSAAGGVTPFMSAPVASVDSYLDLPDGPVMGGGFSHIGREVVGCVAQFREGHWQRLGGPLPTCNGPNRWSVKHMARGQEGVFAVAHAEQGASRLYLLEQGAWRELAIPGPPRPYVKLVGAEGRVFVVGSFDVYERVGSEWLVAFPYDGGVIEQMTVDQGRIYVLGVIPQFTGDNRRGLWVKQSSSWEYLGGHTGTLTSMAVVNGDVYASASLTGGPASVILRRQSGTWQNVYGPSSEFSSVGAVDGQLISYSDRGLILSTPQGERKLTGCRALNVREAVASNGFLLIPQAESAATEGACVFANADHTNLDVSYEPERPLPGEPLRFHVEVSAQSAPTGGVVEIMGLPAGGCVVRNLAPISTTVSRGSCETRYTRNMEVEFTSVFRGFVDANLRSWTPSAPVPVTLQITSALFADSFEAGPAPPTPPTPARQHE